MSRKDCSFLCALKKVLLVAVNYAAPNVLGGKAEMSRINGDRSPHFDWGSSPAKALHCGGAGRIPRPDCDPQTRDRDVHPQRSGGSPHLGCADPVRDWHSGPLRLTATWASTFSCPAPIARDQKARSPTASHNRALSAGNNNADKLPI